jgi:exosortase
VAQRRSIGIASRIDRLSHLPPRDLALWALAVGLAAALVWPAFAHAVEVWSLDDEFSYGFLIPPVSLGLLWWQREAFARSIGPGATPGLYISAAALAIYLVAYRVGINALAGYAVIPLLWGITVYLWGWAAGRVLAFPIGFLVFGLGLFRGLLHTVGFELQEITARGAHLFATTLGLAVSRDGLILKGSGYEFLVAQSCSGMSSLLSLLALSSLLIYFARGTWLARVLVIASVVPAVIVANTTRVGLVLVVADRMGQEAALGFFHGASSLVLFGIALAGIVLVSRLVGCKPPSFA